MKPEEAAALIAKRKPGQVFTVYYARKPKTKKSAPEILKVGKVQGQYCDYAARTPVKMAIKEGLRGEPSLPKYAESVVIGGVRFWRNKNNGKYYLPIVLFNVNFKPDWYVGDKKVDEEAVKPYLLATEFHTSSPKQGQVPFIAMDLENITKIV
jgi:hypothetical protein